MSTPASSVFPDASADRRTPSPPPGEPVCPGAPRARRVRSPTPPPPGEPVCPGAPLRARQTRRARPTLRTPPPSEELKVCPGAPKVSRKSKTIVGKKRSAFRNLQRELDVAYAHDAFIKALKASCQ